MKDTAIRKPTGHIRTYLVLDSGPVLVSCQKNLVVDEGSDISALMAAGLKKLDGMYMCFRNGASVDYSVNASNNAAYYATASANRSFVRVSSIGSPVVTDNKIEIMGVTNGTSFFPAVPVTDGVSVFYHSVLVSRDNETDNQADDMVFSCADLSVPVTKVAGANFGIRWEITF